MTDDWTERAECRTVDTGWFFPTPGDGYAVARACCYRREVRAECLDDALRAEAKTATGRVSRDGMYGGLTPKERAELARDRRRGAA